MTFQEWWNIHFNEMEYTDMTEAEVIWDAAIENQSPRALGVGEAGAAHPVLGEVPSLQAVYDKYKHMDSAIGNSALMLNTFANTMLHECWQAIKEAARHFA